MPLPSRPFDPVQIAQLGSALAAFEGGVATAVGAVLLWGWAFDPNRELRELSAELDGRIYPVEMLDRVPRPEVVETFGAKWSDPAPDLGWLGLIQLDAGTSVSAPLRVRFHAGGGEAVSSNRLRYEPGASLTRLLAPHLPLGIMSPLGIRRVREAIWAPEAARAASESRGGAGVRRFGPDRPVRLSLVLPWRGPLGPLRDTLAYLDMDPDSAAIEVVVVMAGGQDIREAGAAVLSAATGLSISLVHGAPELSTGVAARLGLEAATADLVALLSADVVPPADGWIEPAIAAASDGAWLAPARMARFDGLHARVRPWPGLSPSVWSHAEAEAALDGHGLQAWSPGFVAAPRDQLTTASFPWGAMATPHGFWAALLSHAVRNGAVPFQPAEAFTLAPTGKPDPDEDAWALMDLYGLTGAAAAPPAFGAAAA